MTFLAFNRCEKLLKIVGFSRLSEDPFGSFSRFEAFIKVALGFNVRLGADLSSWLGRIAAERFGTWFMNHIQECNVTFKLCVFDVCLAACRLRFWQGAPAMREHNSPLGVVCLHRILPDSCLLKTVALHVGHVWRYRRAVTCPLRTRNRLPHTDRWLIWPVKIALVIVPLQKGHVYNLHCFWAFAVSAVAAESLFNRARPGVLLVALSVLTPSLSVADSVALTRWAIASHVSRTIWFFHTLLRSGFSRAIAAVAARWRIILCTFLPRHALHACLPSFPDRRLSKKTENLAMGSRWWHAAQVQDPRVLFWHCKHTFRLSSFLCQAERLKYSCVNFCWHTEHCFFAVQDRQTRYMLHRGF